MLRNAKVEAVVPVSDLERAIEFYGGTLGLELLERLTDIPDNPQARFRVGDTTLAVYRSVGAGQSRHTLAAFVVEDIQGTAEGLRSNGVVFEEYDQPGLKTEDGVARTGSVLGAWFRDPDGNILAIAQYA